MQSVVKRYDIPSRWYALKARILGLEALADYDRMAPVLEDDVAISWDEATTIVLEAYGSFSPHLAQLATRLFDERWIDVEARAGKQGGAFCAYTVPSVHPYVLVNYTGRRRDVMALAHELGHALHALLAAPQGVFHHSAPPILSETASVFGETLVLDHLLERTSSSEARLGLLAERTEAAISNVFRQAAMHRFELMAHTGRREEGELSVERLGRLWADTQEEMLGDAVEVTDGFRSWWSFVHHFIHAPGTVYAYVYAHLLALSMYQRYRTQGSSFAGVFIELLSAGGSGPVDAFAKTAGCDLDDPGFWEDGLAVIAGELEEAQDAARELDVSRSA
jgi:oligoendopeptidase F